MTKRLANQKRWLQHVSAWKKSGLSQRAYSRRCGLRWKSLSYWSQKSRKIGQNHGNALSLVRDEQPALELVPVAADLSAVLKRSRAGASALHLQIGSRYRIRIPSDFSGDALAEVIHILEQRR